jgi:hypothetical protein
MRAHRCCPQTPAEAQAAEAPTRVDQESQTVAPFKASWYEYRPQILLTTPNCMIEGAYSWRRRLGSGLRRGVVSKRDRNNNRWKNTVLCR